MCLLTVNYRTKSLDDAQAAMNVGLGFGWKPSDDAPLMTRGPAEIVGGQVVNVPPYQVHPAQMQKEFESLDAANDAWADLSEAIAARLGYRPRSVGLPQSVP